MDESHFKDSVVFFFCGREPFTCVPHMQAGTMVYDCNPSSITAAFRFLFRGSEDSINARVNIT